MHPAKWAEIVPHPGPAPFARVGVDFPDPVTIVIARPFVVTVTDRRVGPRQAPITTPLVGVTGRLRLRRCRHVLMQGRFVRVADDR